MTRAFRFAEFELDVAAYALRHRGERVKLERIPMEVLILLVERAGTLVERSEIQRQQWGAEVFVEHDAAINTAIRKIRRALGDDVATPRFVETVVGKGYKFIAPIESVTRPPPALSAALDAYVRGRHAWNKRGEADLREAIRHFQASIDADPTYAPAYAGLADSYGQLGYGSYVRPEESFPLARAAATRALELDPTLAEAHASLGYTAMYYDWDFPKAETAYRRAIELNPNFAIAHQWYGYLLTAQERPASEAEREIAKAKELDPLSVPIYIDQAYIFHYYGRHEEALRCVRLALEMNPKYPPGWFWLGRIYTSQGRYAEAESALQNLGPLRTWTPAMAVLGYLYGKSSRTQEALGILAEFDALAASGRYASGYAIAIVHAGIGDHERALSSLEAAYHERSHWIVWLKRDPRWDEIRHDARFHALVRRVGLPC